MARFKDNFGDDVSVSHEEDDVFIRITNQHHHAFTFGAFTPKGARELAKALKKAAKKAERYGA